MRSRSWWAARSSYVVVARTACAKTKQILGRRRRLATFPNGFENRQEFRSSDRVCGFFEWADVFKNQWDSSLRFGAEGPDFFPWRADFIGIGFPFRIRAADFFQCGGG